jgi:hypothetical protein
VKKSGNASPSTRNRMFQEFNVWKTYYNNIERFSPEKEEKAQGESNYNSRQHHRH